jgi:hypothetical protein
MQKCKNAFHYIKSMITNFIHNDDLRRDEIFIPRGCWITDWLKQAWGNNEICIKLESGKLEGNKSYPLDFLFTNNYLLALLKLNVCHSSNLFASLKVQWKWKQQQQQI